MARVLAEEEARREHVVVYLSGAHAYGFPSPDSDLDLKAIHVAKTADLLGFEVPAPTVDRAEIIDGVEIDYTSNELAHALAGILGGNGNFLERVLGRMVPHAPRCSASCARSRSARSAGASTGTTAGSRKPASLPREGADGEEAALRAPDDADRHPSARDGQLEPDLTRLMDGYGLSDAAALVERKRAGERVGLDPACSRMASARRRALRALGRGTERSPLPEEPPNEAEVREWLLAVRRARLTKCVR